MMMKWFQRSARRNQMFWGFVKIITVDNHESAVLRKKAEWIQNNEFPLAREIAYKLHAALKHHLYQTQKTTSYLSASKPLKSPIVSWFVLD